MNHDMHWLCRCGREVGLWVGLLFIPILLGGCLAPGDGQAIGDGAMMGMQMGMEQRQASDAYEAQQKYYRQQYENSGGRWTRDMEQERINNLRQYENQQKMEQLRRMFGY